MNLLPGVSLVKIGIYAAIVAFIFGAGVSCEHKRIQPKLDKVTNEFNQFKGGVAALGRAAAERATAQARRDLLMKERADENAKAAADRNRTDIKRVRDANDSRSRGLSAAPSGSKCPASQVCFDAGEFERANGERRAAVRRLADEGTQVEIDHNEAIKWANP
jgi:hypothetical protein